MPSEPCPTISTNLATRPAARTPRVGGHFDRSDAGADPSSVAEPEVLYDAIASIIRRPTEIHGAHRLHGIDAPESSQTCLDAAGRIWRCGQRAALALQDLIGRRTVTCDERDVDRYGRVVAACLVGDVDINEWLVAQGLALAYRRYSRDYVARRGRGSSGRPRHVGGHVRAALGVAAPTVSSGALSPIELAGMVVRR